MNVRRKSDNHQKYTLKSRITQIAQSNTNLIDLVKSPLQLDAKKIKTNKANDNFDKIALETKDKTLLRLAI
jgi:hypothetical protein